MTGSPISSKRISPTDSTSLNSSLSLLERRHSSAPKSVTAIDSRPQVWGKFLWADSQKLYIKGVTYGPFRPGPDGSSYGSDERICDDFTRIAQAGFNTLRVYAPPPRRLLDAAAQSGLRVMVGCDWESHIAFFEDTRMPRQIRRRIRESAAACRDHPAVLCHIIGNEIPGQIVRWYGAKRIENFIECLYEEAKDGDPDALVTYVNYPTTEYLKTPGDFACYNVYLERRDQLEAYLPRLHNLTGDKPLVLAELGLDSIRNGEHAQAQSLSWQIETAFLRGCAGAVVFSWTDEWFNGGSDMPDWAFGLTQRDRTPKPALAAVQEAMANAPFPPDLEWPRISVVVCTYNGSRTIDRCCSELTKLDYPDFEVIVVNDGSTDRTAEIASKYPIRVISTPNQGLSAARNVGAEAANGEIVAYIDDDAWPDPHWLRYLAISFQSGRFGGVGGPNIPPPSDGIADCVANAPGGPIHVLITDEEAEHIPGCNMAFRRDVLRNVGGLDPQFRVAGDDVDLCWRVIESGEKLGYSPAAVVWHHRRASVSGYYRQQFSYGKAEALLEKKWPERYNIAGHVSWGGRIYADHLIHVLHPPSRIYHGVWGMAPFQAVYPSPPTTLQQLASLPEWYLVILATGFLSLLSIGWSPLLFALPFFFLAVGLTLAQAFGGALQASFPTKLDSRFQRLTRYLTTTLLHLIQPIARLRGRLHWGLTPWRMPTEGFEFPRVRQLSFAAPVWRDPTSWVRSMESGIRTAQTVVTSGGDFDDWDLRLQHGLFAHSKLQFAVEELGAGRQFVRVRVSPRLTTAAAIASGGSALLGVLALISGSIVPGLILLLAGGAVAIRGVREITTNFRAVERAMSELKNDAVQ